MNWGPWKRIRELEDRVETYKYEKECDEAKKVKTHECNHQYLRSMVDDLSRRVSEFEAKENTND